APDLGCAYGIASRDGANLLASGRGSPNSAHIVGGELCGIDPLTSRAALTNKPTLLHTITDVVLRRAPEQVIWVEAGWCVAMVQHQQRAIQIEAQKEMGGESMNVGPALAVVQKDGAVSHLARLWPSPEPA